MMYLIHHTESNRPPTMEDVIACRFNCSLQQVKDDMNEMPRLRRDNWGLSTHFLHITENGKRVVHQTSV